MGFVIMILSLLVGLVLLVVGYENKSRRMLLSLGLVLVLFAVFLASPQGSDVAHGVYDGLCAFTATLR
ncbi:hypothetical protein EQ500_07090 [Lactobacillus sp. XV13L]|nr:hypothetical protein [Lactobacillus sp. XV13L]